METELIPFFVTDQVYSTLAPASQPLAHACRQVVGDCDFAAGRGTCQSLGQGVSREKRRATHAPSRQTPQKKKRTFYKNVRGEFRLSLHSTGSRELELHGDRLQLRVLLQAIFAQ